MADIRTRFQNKTREWRLVQRVGYRGMGGTLIPLMELGDDRVPCELPNDSYNPVFVVGHVDCFRLYVYIPPFRSAIVSAGWPTFNWMP
jgi:hypothetical protein